MITSIFFFSGIFICSALITLIIRRSVPFIGGVDQPDNRKLHTRPVPSLGGIAIYISFMGGIVLLETIQPGSALSDSRPAHATLGLIVAVTMVFLLGVYDDLRGANAFKKLVVQISAASILYAVDFRIMNISDPFGTVPEDFMSLGWLSYPMTVLWLVGISNAINLIDGHDGLAGGVIFFAAMTLMAVSIMQGRPDMMWMLLCLSAAVLGFLVWNLPPASIFMGDSGALFLGFTIATLALESSVKGAASVTLLMPIALLALPVTDTLISILRRLLTGQSLVNADRGHIHHRLFEMTAMAPWKTLGLLYGVSLFGCAAGLVTFLAPNTLKWLPPTVLLGGMLWLLSRLGYGALLKSGMNWRTWQEGFRVRRHRKKVRKMKAPERIT